MPFKGRCEECFDLDAKAKDTLLCEVCGFCTEHCVCIPEYELKDSNDIQNS